MRKVIICGLGAIGLTYAVKLADSRFCELKVLVDEKRLKKLKEQKPVFNGVLQDFDYILPGDNYEPDLIIIATKSHGLKDAIKNIKNFVKNGTVIISLINGISSEREIADIYPMAKVLKSYFIGHSAVRNGNFVTQDGVGEIVIEHNNNIEQFFSENNINYSVPHDIDYALWLKFTFNLFVNQTTAILNMNFGELKQNKNFISYAKKIIGEVKQIGEKCGINNLNNLEKDALDCLNKMCDEGKTSMLQDILAKRPTEVDIFAGEVIKLGEKYGIPTPYNQTLYDLIKIMEGKNEHWLYTG